MAKQPKNEDELDDRLADAQAQIESLQAQAADAEARAATAVRELNDARDARSIAEARLAEAAVKYREAKLASAPDIPQDLVPAAETLAEIDEGFEAARRVVGRLRERMQEEKQSARVPVGSPPRRAPDLSSLSPAEKIRLGLQQLSEREGR